MTPDDHTKVSNDWTACQQGDTAAMERLLLMNPTLRRQHLGFTDCPPREFIQLQGPWYLSWLIAQVGLPTPAYQTHYAIRQLLSLNPSLAQWLALGQQPSLRDQLLESEQVPLPARQALLDLHPNILDLASGRSLMTLIPAERPRWTAALAASDGEFLRDLVRTRKEFVLLLYLGLFPETHAMLTASQRGRLPFLELWPRVMAQDLAGISPSALVTISRWSFARTRCYYAISQLTGLDPQDWARAAENNPQAPQPWPTENLKLPRGTLLAIGSTLRHPKFQFHRIGTSQLVLAPADTSALAVDVTNHLTHLGFHFLSMAAIFSHYPGGQEPSVAPLDAQIRTALAGATSSKIRYNKLAQLLTALPPAEAAPYMPYIIALLTAYGAQASLATELGLHTAEADRQGWRTCIDTCMQLSDWVPPPYITALLV